MLRAEAVTRHMQRALVERAQGGDLDAFTELVKAYAPRLHGVAYLILHDIDRAQDAVQDALLMAWRDLRALREPDACDAWLRRLTVRACYGVAKKDRRRTRVELHVTPDPGMGSLPDTSTELAERDWLDGSWVDSRSTSAPSSSCTTTSTSPSTRWPRTSTSPTGPPRPVSIAVSNRCARLCASSPSRRSHSAEARDERQRSFDRLLADRFEGERRAPAPRSLRRRLPTSRAPGAAASALARAHQGAPHAYLIPCRGRVADRAPRGPRRRDLLLIMLASGAVVGGASLLAADGPLVVDPDDPNAYQTISDAVAAAVDGDTVLVKPRHLP